MRICPAAAIAAVSLAALSCGPHPARSTTPNALVGLPPRHDPAIDLADDADLGRARDAYAALPAGDPARAARRAELVAAYVDRIQAELARDDRDGAFTLFERALELWHPRELASSPPAGIDLLVPLAHELRKRFAATGNEEETITALAVLQAAAPSDAWDRELDEIAQYLDALALSDDGPGAERARTIFALERTTEHFPSPWACQRLLDLYLDRQADMHALMSNGGHDRFENLEPVHGFGLANPAITILRLFARQARVKDALPVLDALSGQHNDGRPLRETLHAAVDKHDADSWLQLASLLGGQLEDARAALAVAEAAAEDLPANPAPRDMAARLSAGSLGSVALGIRWALEARALAPEDRDLAELVATLHVGRLEDLVSAERLDAARAELAVIVAFHAEMLKMGPDDPLQPRLAAAHAVMGRGLFNAGEIDEALVQLEKSRALEETPDVVELLGVVAHKRGRLLEAQNHYAQAMRLHESDDQGRMLRRTPRDALMAIARLKRLEGEVEERLGDREAALKLWRAAAQDWTLVVRENLRDPQAAGLAYGELARLYYYMGDHERGLTHFERSVDSDPEQQSVYADAIAFLFTRGHYAPALDAYHRALGRREVSDYFKVYTTLWLVDLARLRGEGPDSWASDFLAARDGHRWFDELARYRSGRLDWPGLYALADTRGKRAEAFFYRAMDRYAAGDRAAAEDLLRDVLATQMLGFFEYDMATYFLDHGPPH